MAEFLIPADNEYTAMLGRAVYNFTYYEWGVVWTIEKIEPGYLQYFSSKKAPTAGDVAKKFKQIVVGRDPRLASCAEQFDELRRERDKLLHAHPYTAAGGAQQLAYRGRHPSADWPLSEVESAARKFDDAACTITSLFYELWPSSP